MGGSLSAKNMPVRILISVMRQFSICFTTGLMPDLIFYSLSTMVSRTAMSFTYDFSITLESRLNMFHVEFNSLHFEINCRDISIEELPYTDSELTKFKS